MPACAQHNSQLKQTFTKYWFPFLIWDVFQASREKGRLPTGGQGLQKGGWGGSSEPFVCSSQGFTTTRGVKDRLLSYSVSHMLFSG